MISYTKDGDEFRGLAPETAEELAEEPVVTADDLQDIDPMEWLAGERKASGEVGHVVIDGKRLKIAPITEVEDNRLLKASRRPDKSNKVSVDYLLYRREYIAKSLTKANPATPITADMLNEARSGYLSQLQTAIQELSGHVQRRPEAVDPFGSSS